MKSIYNSYVKQIIINCLNIKSLSKKSVKINGFIILRWSIKKSIWDI